MSEDQIVDARTEQIVSALKEKNKDSLKSLFSKKALSEEKNIETSINGLFDWLQGNIVSWERDGVDSSESVRDGKKTTMLRYSILISTDKEKYDVFVIDYNVDTINPDNEGIYMLEVSKQSYDGEWDYWQNRMRAGISIIE